MTSPAQHNTMSKRIEIEIEHKSLRLMEFL